MKIYAVILTLFVATGAYAQEFQDYEFVSPLPGSEANTLETTIILRKGGPIDAGTIDGELIDVVGSRSGVVRGDLVLSSDGETIIFKPQRPFAPGEEVVVTVRDGMRTRSSKALEPGQFSFSIAPFAATPNPYLYLPELRPDFDPQVGRMAKSVADTIPARFPVLEVAAFDSADVGEGYIFLAVASDVDSVGYYLMMLNNDGTPFFARELEHDYAYDFKMQPNGMLSYAHFFEHHSYTGGGNVVHKIMDDSFTLVDSVTAGNGYVAEAHDFQILPNGHYLLFGYYLTPVDMSQIVNGGQPDALVSGGVVQELDADKNVIFQWRSWDHYSFDEYPINSRLATRAVVSVFHLNTINLDDDGHIFLGTPQWVKKINRQTGEIMWNLGDFDNDFSFIGVDSTQGVGMVGGHAFHRLASGNVLLYDNGNRQGTSTSRVNEFTLDEANKTAELAWTFVPDSLVSGWHRGNAQRLPNGNTVIGWGGSSGLPSPAMTEVNAAGDVVYEVSFVPPDVESYRAFRFSFTAGAPSSEIVITEVAPGNTYIFADGEGDTGVSVEVNSLVGSGYNELSVTRYDYAPTAPEFFGKAPVVLPRRFVLDNFALNGIDADVQFDIDKWGVRDPDNTVVYHREFEGAGLFLPLATTYNPVKRALVANTTKFGEYILAAPDFESMVFVPTPFAPADSASVNQTLPVMLRWTPMGYVNSYDLQVATDEAFSNLVVDEQLLAEALLSLPSVDLNATLYWRVRTNNDVGTSDWSSAQVFFTAAPFVNLTTPDGQEDWQRGLDYYIRWTDNLDEDVVLELYRDGALIGPITTTVSDGAYLWEVDLSLEVGPGYAVGVQSSVDDALFDMSAGSFNVIDSTATAVESTDQTIRHFALHQSYPNPAQTETTIRFDVPETSPVTIEVHDLLGRKVATIVDRIVETGVHTVDFDTIMLANGTYYCRLSAGRVILSRALHVVR